MAKIMRKMNFKIQMLVGNGLKIYVGTGFEISLTLVATIHVTCKQNDNWNWWVYMFINVFYTKFENDHHSAKCIFMSQTTFFSN